MKKDHSPGQELTVKFEAGNLVYLAGVGLLLFIVFLLRELVLVTLTAVVIAAAVAPVVRRLVNFRVPRVLAVLAIYSGVIIGLAVIFYFLLLPLVADTLVFIQRLPEYMEEWESWNPLREGGSWVEAYPALRDLTTGFDLADQAGRIQDSLRGLGVGFAGVLVTLFGGVLNFILIIVLSFYLVVRKNGVEDFLRLITPVRYENYALDLWGRAEQKIGRWLQGQLVLAVIVGLLVFLTLTLLGVPHALLLAVLAGLLELIPIFGPIVAAVPAILVALVMEDGGVTMALVVTGAYIVIQQIESQLLHPLVVHKAVGLSPIIAILSLVAGYQLAGFLGVLLAVPVSAAVMEFLNDVRKNKHSGSSSVFLGVDTANSSAGSDL